MTEAEEGVVLQEEVGGASGPLVTVTFQRDAKRKEKFLEAEPKALGITQITMSVYNILCVSVFLSKGFGRLHTDIIIFISSVLVVIAGCLAVAAQSLHVPTLKACLGMQIVACGASVCNLVCDLFKMEESFYHCWYDYPESSTDYKEMCTRVENSQSHFYAGALLLQVALLALSVTLSVYCCKVINCCGPAPKMPVITVQSPPDTTTPSLPQP